MLTWSQTRVLPIQCLWKAKQAGWRALLTQIQIRTLKLPLARYLTPLRARNLSLAIISLGQLPAYQTDLRLQNWALPGTGFQKINETWSIAIFFLRNQMVISLGDQTAGFRHVQRCLDGRRAIISNYFISSHMMSETVLSFIDGFKSSWLQELQHDRRGPYVFSVLLHLFTVVFIINISHSPNYFQSTIKNSASQPNLSFGFVSKSLHQRCMQRCLSR